MYCVVVGSSCVLGSRALRPPRCAVAILIVGEFAVKMYTHAKALILPLRKRAPACRPCGWTPTIQPEARRRRRATCQTRAYATPKSDCQVCMGQNIFG